MAVANIEEYLELVPALRKSRDRAHSLRVDGALVDEFRLTHGFWEAKDTHDELGKEVKKKLTAGYPQNNIIFQAPKQAIGLKDCGMRARQRDKFKAVSVS